MQQPQTKLNADILEVQDVLQPIGELRLKMLERDFRALLKNADEAAFAWVGLAWVEYRRGNVEGALENFRKAHNLRPLFGGRVGALLCELGRVDEAMPLLLAAAQEDEPESDAFPANAVVRLGNLAEAYHALGDETETVVWLCRARAAVREGHAPSLLHLANHFAVCGFRDESVETLVKAITLLADNPPPAPAVELLSKHQERIEPFLVLHSELAQVVSDFLAFGAELADLPWHEAKRDANEAADLDALDVFGSTAQLRERANIGVLCEEL